MQARLQSLSSKVSLSRLYTRRDKCKSAMHTDFSSLPTYLFYLNPKNNFLRANKPKNSTVFLKSLVDLRGKHHPCSRNDQKGQF